MSHSQGSREDCSSSSSLASKAVVLPKVSCSSLLRVYTTSLVRAQYPTIYSPTSY